MKRLRLIVGILFCLLFLAGMFLISGRDNDVTLPSADSTRPSGLSAFSALLREDGYRVRIERDPYATFSNNPTVVVVSWLDEFDATIGPTQPSDSFFEMFVEDDSDYKHFTQTLNFFEARGGKIVNLYLNERFTEPSRNVTAGNAATMAGLPPQQYTLSLGRQVSSTSQGFPILHSRGIPVAKLTNRQSGGRRLDIWQGIMATNRFVSADQNADALLAMVREVAPAGSEIVFAETSWGNAVKPSAVARIGPWAQAMWWQGLLVLVVFLFATGKRFGLPVNDPVVERGTADVLQAMGDTLARGSKHDHALFILMDDALERIRTALRASPSESPFELMKQVPPHLAEVMKSIREEYGNVDPARAIQLAQRLEDELSWFERERKGDSMRGLQG